MPTPISNRSPSVYVEYTAKGERVRKLFIDPYKARSFYVAKLKAGAQPKVLQVQSPESGTLEGCSERTSPES